MSSDDTFCSSSGSSGGQPFHSTPVKAKVEFVSSKILIEQGVDFENEVSDSEETPESPENHTTAVSESLNRTSQNPTSECSGVPSYDSRIDKPSAWEQWLLKKEKRRRMQVLAESEQKLKQAEDEKRLLEVKMRLKKMSEEHYQRWLRSKKSELRKRREEEVRENAKKELDSSLAREKLKLITEIQVKKWKDKKLGEQKSRLATAVQGNAKSERDIEEHRQKCEFVYKQWLKDHRYCPRDRYSYGYAGGVLVTYYDATSPPPPTFFNPDPWL